MPKTGSESEKRPPQKSKGLSRTQSRLEREAASILTRRAQRKIPDYVTAEELNLVPYLDVMVNLIIFLLVTISAFLPLGMLSIYPLSVGTVPDNQPEKKPELTFTVFVTKDGFTLAGIGGILPAIPKLASGDYDFEALSKKAVEVKDTYPHETRVILCAESEIKYETLVLVMDTLREKGNRVLFDDVQLSPGMLRR